MDEIRLPQHVLDRIERRWTARCAQMAEACQRKQRTQKHFGPNCSLHLFGSRVDDARRGGDTGEKRERWIRR
jgi:hypothetical protein